MVTGSVNQGGFGYRTGFDWLRDLSIKAGLVTGLALIGYGICQSETVLYYLLCALVDERGEFSHHQIHTLEARLLQFNYLLFHDGLKGQVRGEEPRPGGSWDSGVLLGVRGAQYWEKADGWMKTKNKKHPSILYFLFPKRDMGHYLELQHFNQSH